MAVLISPARTSLFAALALFAQSLGLASSLEFQAEVASSSPSEEHALAEASSTPAKTMGSPKILKLQKQSVILPKTAPRAGKRKNFYSAKIRVGEPGQEFHVSFDLGGGTVVLPSKGCTTHACLERRRYDRWQSASAEDIQADGQLVEQNKPLTLKRRRDRGQIGLNSIDIGSGKAKGTFVRDQVCVGDADDNTRCFPLAMLVASSIEDMPFELEPYDGTVGLGLIGMSVSKEFNFLAGFHQGFKQPVVFPNSFGLHIGGDEDGGEITLGGYDTSRLTHPLKWAPVADPDDGRWQVAISAIRIGNRTLDACKDRACRAAIDFSSSLLAVPSKLAPGLEQVLSFEASPAGFGNGCQLMSIPDIHLDIGGGVSLTLPSEDFVSDFGSSKGVTLRPSCDPLLTHHQAEELSQDVFILGESTLRRYYTFFNADALSVGFSLAAGAPSRTQNAIAQANSKKPAKDKEPVILLFQVKLLRAKTVSKLGA